MPKKILIIAPDFDCLWPSAFQIVDLDLSTGKTVYFVNFESVIFQHILQQLRERQPDIIIIRSFSRQDFDTDWLFSKRNHTPSSFLAMAAFAKILAKHFFFQSGKTA